MRTITKTSLAIIGGLALAANAGAAWSSPTQATALIDWSSLTIKTVGLGDVAPTYTLSGLGGNSNSNTSDWLRWSSDTSTSGNVFGAGVGGSGQGNGAAGAQRSANFTISGSGFLMLSANYSLSGEITGINCYEYYSCYNANTANASVSFDLSNVSAGGAQSHQSHSAQSLSLGNYWQSPLTSDSKQGVLSVGVIVNNGDVVSFSAAVAVWAADTSSGQAQLPGGGSVVLSNGYGSVTTTLVNPPLHFQLTAVPLPASASLLGTALVGLLGLGRKRQSLAV
ncbi:VPLPA-CTERM sorting domain-containing protein [Methylomonas sp. SURF-1]|uniref:VPLPA-CTERM sorting domain-containing protein n=1 Tax=Methylomonas aurea TaxID=2952224 RepID=A0ABT1UIB2_9GAMM|nr:VPLPA-CTERM sorting domain-containing protein [Methylomonas sp. SURF-1]MCQ8181982.1 VPLPA-CTERM sorting domain-containing protein [Methylomonas sp. SURF-1]